VGEEHPRRVELNRLGATVCERSITGDIYGHSSDTAARAAIEGLSGTLGL
jgi:hypothetical protein